ncbi:hypothetical protein HGM15179_015511 [Zosterops borbonicus]|uniref:Uracil-DNA glycosylase-like domain-containing protein n=1 Tax=Zosterops borbonicus TaxID=364589 RepID=A0A8K1G4Z1_9PASS|nr:hypothetical protein HGM15179_015511 [Zosterops borbonicus]
MEPNGGTGNDPGARNDPGVRENPRMTSKNPGVNKMELGVKKMDPGVRKNSRVRKNPKVKRTEPELRMKKPEEDEDGDGHQAGHEDGHRAQAEDGHRPEDGHWAGDEDGHKAQDEGEHRAEDGAGAEDEDGHQAEDEDGHQAEDEDGHQAEDEDGHQAGDEGGHWAGDAGGHRAAGRADAADGAHAADDTDDDDDDDEADEEGIAERFLALERALSEQLRALGPPGPPVAVVYAPLEYAWEPHQSFVRRYLRGPRPVLFLGMNPGPFGMAQTGVGTGTGHRDTRGLFLGMNPGPFGMAQTGVGTGDRALRVPFGEARHVREWLRVGGSVLKPPQEHPKRPVLGLSCPRSEISGRRFWGLVRSLCPAPRSFFRRCFVHNLCPLLFLAPSGRNVAPPELRPPLRRRLLALCGDALVAAVVALRVALVVALGRVAEQGARRALRAAGLAVRVTGIPHPSPRNPRANRGWETQARARLEEEGVLSLLGEDFGGVLGGFWV